MQEQQHSTAPTLNSAAALSSNDGCCCCRPLLPAPAPGVMSRAVLLADTSGDSSGTCTERKTCQCGEPSTTML